MNTSRIDDTPRTRRDAVPGHPMDPMPQPEVSTDRVLVERTHSGDRAAFGALVTRYQTLVCSIAYNACGDFGRSEDLAQETFVAAWKNLPKLAEPDRFRGWLCGIARNVSNSARRRSARQPVDHAEEESALNSSLAETPSPLESAVSREESATVWAALERLPETYREPLILFYREGHSIPRVAEALDLTEEAVRQRLSRGRALLRDEMTRTVEGVLTRTIPGAVFTAAVLSSLPGVGTETARAASFVGGASLVAKGAAAAKGTTAIGLLSLIAGPLIGLVGGYLGFRAGYDRAESDRERHFLVRSFQMTTGIVLLMTVAFIVTVQAAQSWAPTNWAKAFAWTLAGSLTFTFGISGISVALNRRWSQLRTEEALKRGTVPEKGCGFEWESSQRFLGIPWVSVRFSGRMGRGRPAVGWVALGDVAVGLLVAVGGMSFGTVSIGGLALGTVALGGMGIGALALGGIGVGYYSFGGMSLGIMASGGLAVAVQVAFGGMAVAVHAAQGGLAIARDFAVGGSAHALHANDNLAREVLAQSAFVKKALWLNRNSHWLQLLVLIPALIATFAIQMHRRGGTKGSQASSLRT